jgi:hypothetical protein
MAPFRWYHHRGCIAWFDSSVKISADDSTGDGVATFFTAIIGPITAPT